MRVAFAVLLMSTIITWADATGQCMVETVRPPTQSPAERLRRVKAVWQRQQPLNASTMEQMRRAAWSMFDHGFSNYMKHAFPKDNLLPVSCGGQDWQGGLGLTLVDSLDMLLLLNRRGDIQQALVQLGRVLDFDKDVKVHVFETTIRVLGGLLSGHVLLADDPGLAPGYDGLLLRLASDLGDRLLAAFKTPSGLPGGHVHLQKGLLAGENISCTACAGTLLLEFGLLSRLTGKQAYMDAAHHAAQVLFDQRSALGLVGSGYHVVSHTWSHRDSTIGPGSDSYYEYLLKAYLMFGERTYLDMFTELYVATMRHMEVPGQLGASSSAFLLDVHMDSGRLLKPWVSSLGAFWPAMQVLAGQQAAAERLHGNFTAAWATWGWLPEMFGADLSTVHPEDPGYNLRPEHIESTWYLKAVTGDPGGYYGGLAASMMAVLNTSRVRCGYAPITNVNTGAHTDLMESYFLSETVKYLYLSFVDSGPLLDYYLLSTEGHLMPAFTHPADQHVELDEQQQQDSSSGRNGSDGSSSSSSSSSRGSSGEVGQQQQHPVGAAGHAAMSCQEGSGSGSCDATAAASNATATPASSSSSSGAGSRTGSGQGGSNHTTTTSSLVGKPLADLPANCRPLCVVRDVLEEEGYERRLHVALPLLPVRRAYSRRIRYRRCVACLHTTQALQDKPPDSLAVRLARLNFGQNEGSASSSGSGKQMPPPADQLAVSTGGSVLAQVLCVLKVYKSGAIGCHTIRRLTALDSAVGLTPGTLILQLTAVQPDQALATGAVLASFDDADEGPVSLQFEAAQASFGPQLPQLSRECLTHLVAPRQRMLLLPDCPLVQPTEPPVFLRRSSISSSSISSTSVRQQQQQRHKSPWVLAARARDPWLGRTPSSRTCRALHAQLAAAAAAADSSSDASEQQQQPGAVGEGVSVAEPDHQRPVQLTAADVASPGLRAGCVGIDAAAESWEGGSWLHPEELLSDQAGCVEGPKQVLGSMPRAAPLVLAEPLHACGPIKNAALWRGAIVVISRGRCSFIDKAMTADKLGAVGVVVLNTMASGELLTMSGDETGRAPDIPAVLMGGGDSRSLLWWMQHRPLVATIIAQQPPPVELPQQQQQGKDSSSKQQQQQQQTHSSYVQTRVDLFIPGRSQGWLQEHVVGDTSALFAKVVKDPRILKALEDAMHN